MATAKPHEDIDNYHCLDCGAGAGVVGSRVRVDHDFYCSRYPVSLRLQTL